MRYGFFAAAFATVLLGAGCAGSAPAPAAPTLSYQLPADGSVTVTQSAVDAGAVVSAEALLAQAEECGYARVPEYYLDVDNLFAGLTGTRYVFSATANTQAPETWTVTVLPNAPAYGSTDSFKTDFDICAAGGDLYPVEAGANALLFVSGCGSGYDDGSGQKVGCDVARAAVEATLSIE